ncbi:MAG: hypothetical protein LBB60_01760 [Desulfovibrio sp.]|jgi:hypothetical protein|nr:hypothetical protein [Desulfovibrio sp.]
MPIDWLIYGLLVLGMAQLLNAAVFKKKPAPPAVAAALAVVVFFVNLAAFDVSETLRHIIIPESAAVRSDGHDSLKTGGAFVFALIFFAFLNRRKRENKR